MKQCEWENKNAAGETIRCKFLVANSENAENEERILCPLHAGVVAQREDNQQRSDYLKATQSRFETHLALAEHLSPEDLNKHILQLESIIEDSKLGLQASMHVRNKRLKKALESNSLTPEQLAEVAALRGANHKAVRELKEQTKVSKEEKEIQKLMKQGLSREKAIKLLLLE